MLWSQGVLHNSVCHCGLVTEGGVWKGGLSLGEGWCLKLSEAWPFTRQFSLAARTPDGCLRHSLADEGGQARHAVTLRRPRQPVYVADVARKGLSRDPGLAVSLQGFRISGPRGQASKRQGGEVNTWGYNKGKMIPSQGAEWHGLVGG